MSRDPYAVGDIDSFQARKDEEITQAIEERPWIKSTQIVCPQLLLDSPETLVQVLWSNGTISTYAARIVSESRYWREGYYSTTHITHWRPLDK